MEVLTAPGDPRPRRRVPLPFVLRFRPVQQAITRLVDAVVAPLGLEVIRRSALGATQARHLQRLLPALSINLVLDVGANVGGFATEIRGRGYGGRIVSFEPTPIPYAKLEVAARADRDWMVRKQAVGENDGQVTVNVARTSEMSSVRTPSADGFRIYGDATDVIDRESVWMTTLDSALVSVTRGIDRPRILLKSDTQGHDLDVLAGATKTLDQVVAIHIELTFVPAYTDAPSHLDVLHRLDELGFVPLRMFAADHARPLNPSYMDGVFIRPSGQLPL